MLRQVDARLTVLKIPWLVFVVVLWALFRSRRVLPRLVVHDVIHLSADGVLLGMSITIVDVAYAMVGIVLVVAGIHLYIFLVYQYWFWLFLAALLFIFPEILPPTLPILV